MEDYLKTAFEYFSEEIKSKNEIENEQKRNLFIEAANEDMIVNYKPTFKKWPVGDEFASDYVTIPDDGKSYIDDLLKKPDVIPNIEILPEPAVSPIPNFKQTSLPAVNTIDKILSMDTESNKDTLKKEENKIEVENNKNVKILMTMTTI